MDCDKVEDLLSGYIENDLSRDIRKEISRHLEKCDECRLLKEKIEELIHSFPELQEDVPFFLKNRLYFIPESQQREEERNSYLKWVAAVVGTFVLFLNLFYFTNIYPPANRALHSVVSSIETLAVETGAFFEKVKESKDLLFYSFFNEDKDKEKLNRSNKSNINIKRSGGQNG